jgi:VanZ family protein
MNKKTIFKWGVVFIWMGVIFAFSHQDASASSDTSGWVVNVIQTVMINVTHEKVIEQLIVHFIREIAHFTVYFVLGLLLFNALSFKGMIQLGFVLIIGGTYALLDEWHQTFIPGRAFELTDILIDLTGVFSASLIGLFVKK